MMQIKSASPLISVIIPCYNQGQFLEAALSSVAAQKYSQTEVIIVNDGSSEAATLKILQTLKKTGVEALPRLNIFHLKNRGLAGARNYGLSKAHGDFIQFLDADDQLLPGKFRRQLAQFAREQNLAISYTKYQIVAAGKKSTPPSSSLCLNDPIRDFLFRWESQISLPPHCFLFRRDCFTSHRFNEHFRACEDWVLWSELALAGFTFAPLDFVGAAYFQHPDSMSQKRDQMYLANVLATAHLRSLIKNNRALVKDFDQAAIKRLKDIFYRYYGEKMFQDNPDRQELRQIKSSKFFKFWQGYNQLLQKLHLKKVTI